MTNLNWEELKAKMEKYWKDRSEKAFLAGEKDVLKFANDLEKIYKQANKQIEVELSIFYNKYSGETGLDIIELRKLLTKDELKDFKTEIKRYVEYAENNGLDKNYITNLKLLEFRSRVSRLEELKTNIDFEVEKLGKTKSDKLTKLLSDTYSNTYYKTIFNEQKFIGLATSFTALNTRAIEKAIKTTYLAENYSDVLWKNKETLKAVLEQQVPQGLILGYNPKKVAMIAEKKLKTDYNSTVRLARTEYNLILNEATADSYAECGIERYQLLATLDNRTSEICQEMDMKIFKLKEKEVGVNYPPFHPNCRTTVTAYFDPDEFSELEKRIAKDEFGNYYEVPGNITYKEWQDSLEETTDGNLVYKGRG